MRAPFDIPVQRFGTIHNQKMYSLDYWGPQIFGKNKVAARRLNAIKPEWNSLTKHAKGKISKGTPMKFGITGPQGWKYPGGLPQFRVRSKQVIIK